MCVIWVKSQSTRAETGCSLLSIHAPSHLVWTVLNEHYLKQVKLEEALKNDLFEAFKQIHKGCLKVYRVFGFDFLYCDSLSHLNTQ